MIGQIISEVGAVARKVIGDKDLAAKFEHELNTHGFQERIAQIRVNEKAAESGSLFQAGGRAFALWACAIATTAPLIVPWLAWLLMAMLKPFGVEYELPPLPNIDPAWAYATLSGLLGLNVARSWEKGKGVARNQLKPGTSNDAFPGKPS